MSILPDTSEDELTITTTGAQGTFTISAAHDDWQYADYFSKNSIQALTTQQLSALNSISTSSINVPLTGPYDNYNLTTVKTPIKYVIAGNREQYSAFIKRKGFSDTEYHYLYDADMLEGMRNVHGFYVGSWRERDDIEEIKKMIYKCNQKNPNER